jgi:hypothetical protein
MSQAAAVLKVPDLAWKELSTTVATLFAQGQGFTLGLKTAKHVPPRDTWAVSLAGGLRSATVPSPDEIRAFLGRVRAALTKADGRRLYLGGWVAPNDEYCLDFTVLIDDVDEARTFGDEQDQEAIYNLLTREEIYLERRDRRASA